MQTVRPQSPNAILALARHAARAERAWRALLRDVRARVTRSGAPGVTELAITVLQEYDAEIRGRVLRAELRRFGVVPDRHALRSMLQFIEQGSSGARYQAARGVRLERAFDVLRITRARAAQVQGELLIEACGDGAGYAGIGEKRWQVRWTTSPEESARSERFACSALRFPLELRGWRPGDRMRLAYGSKKLKKLMAEARIPFADRDSIPILVDATGRVCWVVGVARSIDAPPQPNAPALTITVTDVETS